MARAAAILFVLLLAACSPSPDTDPQQLRSLAQETRGLVALPVLGNSAIRSRDIPSHDWPPSVIFLKPEAVRVSTDGLYIKTWSSFVEEAGYFIPRDAAHFRPEDHGDPSFKALSHGIYWYEVKG